MPLSKDCVNTQSENGRNLTPEAITAAAREVLGFIGLDPCSDEIANRAIKADRYLTIQDDGYSQKWDAFTMWLNPPGNSLIGGTHIEREEWRRLDREAKRYKKTGDLVTAKKLNADKPKSVSVIKAAHWHQKACKEYFSGNIDDVIGLVYRGGSIGSLGRDMLSSATICLTASGVESPVVNGSGRLSFETVENEERHAQTSNTQSSLIYLLSNDLGVRSKFLSVFSQFGVIFEPQ